MAVPKSKKRKIGHDTSKPSAVFAPTGPRLHTLSVALPGSIIANAQSHEQKTNLAGTIARALAVFCVDEIVIFDDGIPPGKNRHSSDVRTDEYTAFSDPSHFLAHLLAYLETPPYLRKLLFPVHPNLRMAGTLPSLDMPHHLRASEWCDYREGVVVSSDHEETSASNRDNDEAPQKKKKKKGDMANEARIVDSDTKTPTFIDIGLPQKIQLSDHEIPVNTRVTVKLKSRNAPAEGAEPVDPTAPRVETGYYWGYSVRRCSSLSAVFTECPFDGGYDLSFGTSERGRPLISSIPDGKEAIVKHSHLLVVFGGVAGIEAAIASDQELLDKGLTPEDPARLFDYWVNVLPKQGSRTIRTEEAIWLGLMGLRGFLERSGR